MTDTIPPIVVILGHVDHGKTSLLDAIRKTDVAASEEGGITQSVRAFQITTPYPMTFIDTPGHAAFSQMRSRGGKVADIALLIVSGVDGVMPQTRESITTIKKAGIPYIVVLTKQDLPDYTPDKIKTQLAESEVLVEGFGGDIPLVLVSAKTGAGLPELLDMISLVREMNPVTHPTSEESEAVVLESSLDPKRGVLAVVIVKHGQLSEGMNLFIGQKNVGKIKALRSTSGERVTQVTISQPAEILGLTQVPAAGAILSDKPHDLAVDTTTKNGGTTDGYKIILKTDVVGSLEAILASLGTDIQVVLAATGDITESDVLRADTARAVIIGFNIKASGGITKLAETEKVKIYNFKIIYELLDEVHKLAHPEIMERITGRALISAEFKIDAIRVAGSRVLEGELKKGDMLRILRNDVPVGETKFKSLKTGKTELEMVKAGQEFGAVFGPHIDFKTGDTISAYKINAD